MNKRVFLAVNLPPETKKRIASELSALLPEKVVKAVEEQNLHITMYFLGHLDEQGVKKIIEWLSVVREREQFRVELKGIGHFRNRVLWLGVGQGSERLVSLGNKITEALEVKDEKFHPHVTLARNKSLKAGEVDSIIAEMEKKGFCETVEAESLDVMESVLSPEGPAYSVLERIEFGQDRLVLEKK